MTKNVCTIFIVIYHISDLTTLNDISKFQKWQAFFLYFRATRTNRQCLSLSPACKYFTFDARYRKVLFYIYMCRMYKANEKFSQKQAILYNCFYAVHLNNHM